MVFSKPFIHFSRAFSQTKAPSKILNAVPEYKSLYSLDKVYPNSSLNLAIKFEPPTSSEKFSGFIPMNKLKVHFARSGKPGGQNTNKIDTQAIVTFKLSEAEWIPEHLKPRLVELHRNSITKDGNWIIRSQKTRQATINLADCLDKIRSYITEVEAEIKPPPDPVTLEMRREQYERAAQERLRQKRSRSASIKIKNQTLREPI